jgi:hypothetical protein
LKKHLIIKIIISLEKLWPGEERQISDLKDSLSVTSALINSSLLDLLAFSEDSSLARLLLLITTAISFHLLLFDDSLLRIVISSQFSQCQILLLAIYDPLPDPLKRLNTRLLHDFILVSDLIKKCLVLVSVIIISIMLMQVAHHQSELLVIEELVLL